MKNRKAFVFIVACILVAVMISGCSQRTDAGRFKNDYESLNGKEYVEGHEYLPLHFTDMPTMQYVDCAGAAKLADSAAAVIYFGYPECPWCREELPVLIQVASEYPKHKLYYCNAYDERDDLSLDDAGKTVVNDAGSEGYKKLLAAYSDILSVYKGLNDEGVKRVYFPTALFIKDGKAVAIHVGGPTEHSDAYSALTTEEYDEEYKLVKELFNQVYSDAK